MKATSVSKTDFFESGKFEVLTEKEMNNVQGGARYYLIVDENGNYRIVLIP